MTPRKPTDSGWQLARVMGNIPEEQIATGEEIVTQYRIVMASGYGADDAMAAAMNANPISVESALVDAGFDALGSANVSKDGMFVNIRGKP